MKILRAEPGLKVNPVYLLNTIGDINEDNWREAVNRLFTPGLFIPRNSNGVLGTDFSTELVNPATQGQTDYKSIKVSISDSIYPSRALTRDGKLITLYANYNVTPYDLVQTNGDYGLYIKPIAAGIS